MSIHPLSSFSVITLNCKGMNQKEKREKIFNLLKAKHADIICLQETRTNPATSKLIEKLWHLKISWNSHTAILINNKKIQSISFYTELDNRCIKCTFKLNNQNFCIYNIYAPPDRKNRFSFWQKFSPLFQSSFHNIIVGDFNSILNPDRDRSSNSQATRDPSIPIINQKLKNFTNSYSDLELTPNFTFFSTTAAGSFRGKLDYVFSDQIPPYHCKNETFYAFSDHLALYVHFKPTSSSHTTNNIWKLNNSILKDQNLKLELENSNTTEFQSWDELKYFWRNILIQFKKPNTNPINKMTRLSRDIDRLSNILKKFPNADDIRKVISSKQEQSKLLAEENSEYWRIRSKARWIEEGEISSKYFFSRFKIRNNDSYIQYKK